MTQTTSAATGAGEIEKRLRQVGENMKAAFDNPDFHEPLLSAADALAALREENEELLSAVTLANECRADLSAENEKLRKALEDLIAECDDARHIERGAGGMTIDAQINRTIINGVRARKVEDARAVLSEKPAAEKEIG